MISYGRRSTSAHPASGVRPSVAVSLICGMTSTSLAIKASAVSSPALPTLSTRGAGASGDPHDSLTALDRRLMAPELGFGYRVGGIVTAMLASVRQRLAQDLRLRHAPEIAS